jgi:hypothetical protein
MDFKSLDKPNSTFYVSNNACVIRYNQNLLNVTKILTFSPDTFKIETNDRILKYSKGLLSIYNKNGNSLVETFEKIGVPQTAVSQQTSVTSQRFVLKENYIIQLLDETTIKNNGDIELIVSKTDVGSIWNSYDTDKGNRLWVSKDSLYHHKWNGIPIGKI